MWPVEIAIQVNEYLDDFNSDKLVIELRKSIIRLFWRNDGLPSEGEIEELDDGFYRWIIHHHTMILQQEERQVGNQKTLFTSVLLVLDSEIRSEEETKRQIAKFRN